MTETTTSRHKKTPWYVPLLLGMTLIAVTGSVIVNLFKPPSEADLIRDQTAAKIAKTWGVIAPWLLVLSILGSIVAIVILVSILIRFLNARASETRPRDGLFPVKSMRALRWRRFGKLFLPTHDIVLHDANRAPGATTVYVDGVPTFFATPDISPGQLRVTQGAQLTQMAAAIGDTAGHPMARQFATGQTPRIQMNMDVNGRPALLSPAPAKSRTLPISGSHVASLLTEQGELLPDRPIDRGESSV